MTGDVYIQKRLQLCMPDGIVLTDEEKGKILNSDLIPLMTYRNSSLDEIGDAIVIDGIVNAIIREYLAPELTALSWIEKPPAMSVSAWIGKGRRLEAIVLIPALAVPG